MPKSSVQKTEYEVDDNGSSRTVTQYRATIPKQLAEFFQLDQGDELIWSAGSARNKLEVEIVEGDGDAE